MFYKVSYNQGLAEELGIVTLLFVICVYSKIITKS